MLAMLMLMLVILRQAVMLIYLNTSNADTDAELCIRIMSLCCSIISRTRRQVKSIAGYTYIVVLKLQNGSPAVINSCDGGPYFL